VPVSLLHHRCAADHFQVGNSGKISQDFILHAVCEVSISFSPLSFSKERTAMLFSGIAARAMVVAASEQALYPQR